MKRLIRVLLSVIALVVVLFIVAVVVATLYFDPNDFKDQLSEAVKEHTGRDLEIKGNIDLSVFPWLGVEVGKIAMGNAPGFDEPVFASADRTQIRVKLLPLLRKQLEMDTVSLYGLNLKLARDKQGHGNWEDLTQPQAEEAAAETKPSQPAPAEGGLPLAGLAIGGLDIRDARVSWDDAQAGQRYTIDRLALQSGAVVPGKPIDLELRFHLAGGTPPVDGDVSLKGTADLDPEAQRYRVRDLVLDASLTGEGVPGQTLDLALATQADLDLSTQTLSVPELELKTLGMLVTGALAAEGVLGEPRYNASLKVAEFSPRALLERLGQPPLETADPKVLQSLSLTTRLTGSTTQANLEDLKARLDQTNLEGRVEVPRFQGPAVRFDLSLDDIDADRYLPPPAEGEKPAEPAPATPGAATAAAAGDQGLPMETLRALDVDGNLRIGRLKISNLRMTDILLKLTAKDGLIKLDPTQAQLYQGSYLGHIRLDARGKQPKLAVDERLTGVQAGPLLKDFMGEERLLGRAGVTAKLTMVGDAAEAMKKSLNGTADFAFLDGAVKGVNVAHMIRAARARIRGEPPPAEEPKQTDFTELSGSIKFTNGVGRNHDLQAKSPLLRLKGEGTANLVTEQLDYLLTTVVVDTGAGQGGKEMEDLKGLTIPIKVTGSFQEPKYKLELEKLISAEAKKQVQEKVEKKIEKELGGKLDGKTKDLLKGLFR
jgi:AsmA protein